MTAYREVGEAGWRWAVAQVRHDDVGRWLPSAVPTADVPRPDVVRERAGIHSGLGGLGLGLAEVRRARPWTEGESALAADVVAVVDTASETSADPGWFDGLAGSLEVLRALHAPDVAAERAVARLLDLATVDGWPSPAVPPPRFLPGAPVNDATLGAAAVLRAAVAEVGRGTAGADDLADRAVRVVLAEVEVTPEGPAWPFVPRRFRADPTEVAREMPGWSHGAAGVATVLADAAGVLGRPDLLDLAAAAAARLVAVGDTSDDALRVPGLLPPHPDHPPFAHGRCHGGSGTSLLFAALARAGVDEVAGRPPSEWVERCWRGVEASGLPARLRPGSWDNDGRCCGTAGVGDLALDAGRTGFARVLADALVERAEQAPRGPGVDDGVEEAAAGDGAGGHAWWRFVEHRAEVPLLPPSPGWMQGAAGVAAFLLRAAREL